MCRPTGTSLSYFSVFFYCLDVPLHVGFRYPHGLRAKYRACPFFNVARTPILRRTYPLWMYDLYNARRVFPSVFVPVLLFNYWCNARRSSTAIRPSERQYSTAIYTSRLESTQVKMIDNVCYCDTLPGCTPQTGEWSTPVVYVVSRSRPVQVYTSPRQARHVHNQGNVRDHE